MKKTTLAATTAASTDSARIGGSYTLTRAFLWAIPLLGFIGTVVLSKYLLRGDIVE